MRAKVCKVMVRRVIDGVGVGVSGVGNGSGSQPGAIARDSRLRGVQASDADNLFPLVSPPGPTVDFEQQFRGLLDQARVLADEFRAALPEIVANEFPQITVVRVIVGTLPMCDAALMALADPSPLSLRWR